MTRILRRVVILVLVAIAAAAALFLAPTDLGGRTTFMTVRGASMEPRLHAGDFVVLRRAARYAKGDVVAYRSDHVDATVLHRIVADGDDGFVLRGDNNDFTDPDRPDAGDIVGRLWLDLPSPGTLASSRELLLGCAGLGTLLVAAWPAARVVRKRRGSRPAQSDSHARPGRWSAPVTAVAGMAAVAAGLAWVTPMLRPSHAAPFTHSGRIDYGIPVDRPDVYPDGSVDTGEPVFLSLAPHVEARFRYRFESATPHAVQGTVSLRAVLTNADGLHRDIAIASEPLVAGAADAGGILDAAGLWGHVEQFAAATSTSGSSAVVTLRGHVDVRGSVDGGAFDERFEQEVVFDIDRVRMRLTGSELGRGQAELTARRPGRAAEGPADDVPFMVAGRAMSVSVTRGITTTVAVAGVLMILVAYRRRRRSHPHDPLHRHKHRVVPTEKILVGDAVIADVADAATITALADTLDRPILRVPDHDGDLLLIVTADLIYRHRLRLASGAGHHGATGASLTCDERTAAVLREVDGAVDVTSGEWLEEFALDHLLVAPAGFLAVRSVDGDRIRGADNHPVDDGLKVQAQLASAGARRLQASLTGSGASDVRLVGTLIRWDDPHAETAATREGTVVLNGHNPTQWVRDLSRPLVDADRRRDVAAAVGRHSTTA